MSPILLSLLDEAGRRLRVDDDRVYLAGVNAGGAGVWKLALTAPDRLAALICATAPLAISDEATEKLRVVPAWLVASANQADIVEANKQLAEALVKAHGEAKASTVPQAPPEAWQKFFTDPALGQWLLKHKKQ